jgi:hypothetical protein
MKENSAVAKTNEQKETHVDSTPKNPLSLITGKYTVKPCRKSWLYGINPNHDGNTIFTGAQIWIVAERVASNPDMIITGLSTPEQIAFEVEMGMQTGTLSPYNKVWWSKHSNAIKIPKDGLELDCDNNVKHKLFLKILQANSRVANSLEELAVNSVADVVITSKEAEARIDSSKFVTKAKAYAKYNSLSQADKINFLKVFNNGENKVSNSTKPDLIDQAIGKIVDGDPDKFLSTFDNMFFKDFVLLEDFLSNGVVVKKGGRYFINGGVELGLTKEEVVSKLRSDEFQDTKISLIAQLEATK